MVMILLMVMMLVVAELSNGAQVQALSTANLVDEHFAFYAEETALIKAEEVLFQDIEPPPKRPPEELFLSAEQMRVEEKKKGTDSYHDHWATMRDVEKVGHSWMMTELVDEERAFNINTLIDQRTGQWIPKRKDFFKALLEVLEVKDGEIPGILDELKDQLDPNDTGKYESKVRNGLFKLCSHLLFLENIEEELYHGKNYPSGELFLLEDQLALEDEQNFDLSDDEDGEEDKTEKSPFVESEKIPYEDWDEDEIKPGLKDLLTVYGDGKINLNTAPLPILQALLGGDEKAALELVRARKETPFAGHEDVKLVPGAHQAIAKYGDMIDYKSNYFSVKTTFQHRRVRKSRVSLMMREGPQAITLFRGASL